MEKERKTVLAIYEQAYQARDLGKAWEAQKLVDEQLAKGIQIEDKPVVRRAISTTPVVKPIRVNAPNSVFALGNVFAKS